MFKKKIKLLLVMAITCTLLCSCGGAKVDMDKAESYGKVAGEGTYESYDHVEDIVVLMPVDGDTVQKVLENNVGELEQYKKDIELKNTQALVLENFIEDESTSDKKIYFVGKKAKSQQSIDAFEYGELDASDINNGKIEFYGEEYTFKKSKGIVDGLEWLLAETLVANEDYENKNKDKIKAALAAEKEAKGSMSDEEWNTSDEYYQLVASNSVYDTYDCNRKFVAYLEGIINEIKELDNKDEKFKKKCEKIYAKYLNESLYDCAIVSNEILKYQEEKTLKSLKSNSEYNKYAPKIKELQSKSDNYRYEEAYLEMVLENNYMEKLEESLHKIEMYEVENKLLNELRGKYEYNHFSNAKEEIEDVETAYDYFYHGTYGYYFEAVEELDSFMDKNSEAIKEYEDGIKALEEKYESKKELKKDIEYKKLETKHGETMKEKKELEKAVTEAEKELKAEEMYGKTYEEAVFAAQYRSIEENDIVKYINKSIEEVKSSKASESLDNSKVIGEAGGFIFVKMSDSIVSEVDENRSVRYRSSGSSYSGGSSYSDKAKYDPDDPYYSTNDHDGDGYIDGNEFQDAMNDAIEDKLSEMY